MIPINSNLKVKLINQAKKAQKNAYAPFSHFPVGAALLAESNKIYCGCNVENSSFGLTICAERNALAHAVASGEKKFKCMVIVAPTSEPVTPCGACRQVLSEFTPQLPIISVSKNGIVKEFMLDALLPSSFKFNSSRK